MQNLEHLQKRAMKKIFPHQPYTEALELAKLEPVSESLLKLSKTFFNKIQNPEDRLHDIPPFFTPNIQYPNLCITSLI